MSLYDSVVCFYTNKLYPYEWVVGYVKQFCFHCTTYTLLPLEQREIYDTKKRAAPCEVSLGPHFISSLSAFFVDCRIHLCATKVGQLKSNATLTLLVLAVLWDKVYSLKEIHSSIDGKGFPDDSSCLRKKMKYRALIEFGPFLWQTKGAGSWRCGSNSVDPGQILLV